MSRLAADGRDELSGCALLGYHKREDDCGCECRGQIAFDISTPPRPKKTLI